MMPEDWKAKIGKATTDLFRRGRLARQNPRSRFVVGLIDKIPPEFDQYVNLAGSADAAGVPSPLATASRRYRFLVVREKHRGEYSVRRCGRMFPDPIAEFVTHSP